MVGAAWRWRVVAGGAAAVLHPGTLVVKGAGSLSLDFFTSDAGARRARAGGGVAHAIVGTLHDRRHRLPHRAPDRHRRRASICAEFPGSRLADGHPLRRRRDERHCRRSWSASSPGPGSWPSRSTSPALAGSAALAMLMIPMVMRTTEEMIKLVPHSLREAALALGYPRWRTSLQIVLRTALPGIVTGALLAVARVAGETAPLLFTALGNQYLSTNLTSRWPRCHSWSSPTRPVPTTTGTAWPGPRPSSSSCVVLVLERSRGRDSRPERAGSTGTRAERGRAAHRDRARSTRVVRRVRPRCKNVDAATSRPTRCTRSSARRAAASPPSSARSTGCTR